MKPSYPWIAAAALLGAAFASPIVPSAAAMSAREMAMAEMEKAQANPYPSDRGSNELPADLLKTYPKEAQEGYKLLEVRCAQCHKARRPLNSRFVEPPGGKDEAKQEAALAKLKKEQPELFQDKAIWQPEVMVWHRYIARMMLKPGCHISPPEAHKIWVFLVYDGIHRKTGAAAAAWAAHRKELIKEFQAEETGPNPQHPGRYAALKAADDL